MRKQLESVITEKVLHVINQSGAESIIDALSDDPKSCMTNVCAKVSTELSQEISKVCDLLGVSKRRFLECAFIDAVNTAHRIIDEEGMWEAVSERNAASAESLGA